MPHVIAFANQKGGVGKTSSVVNLAAAFGQEGENVLIIDLDAQANATRWLGAQICPRSKAEDFWLRKEETDLRDYITETEFEGIWVVPASAALYEIEPMLRMRENRPLEVLKHYVGQLRSNALDFVFIDCPPSIGSFTKNALAATDEVLIPLFSTGESIEGLVDLERSIEGLRKDEVNTSVGIGGIFVAFRKHGTKLTDQVQDWARDRYGDRFLEPHIRENVAIRESYMVREPVVYYDPGCNGSQDYKTLARTLLTRYGKERRQTLTQEA